MLITCRWWLMPVPSDQIPIGEGRLYDGGTATFFVSKRSIELLVEHGQSEKLDEARFLEIVIAEPDAIFVGLLRPNQEDGLCYSVRPEHDPDDSEIMTLPRYGCVFLAFVELKMGYVVFDWEWRDEDPDVPGHPIHWDKDFARRAYACD